MDSILCAIHYLFELQDKQSAVGYIETMLRYIYEVGKDLTKEGMGKIIERLESNELKGSEFVMTLAEMWKNEGIQQCLQQGEKKALSRMALTLLTQRFGDLPRKVQQAIDQANMETLNHITFNNFTLKDLDEVEVYLSGEVSS